MTHRPTLILALACTLAFSSNILSRWQPGYPGWLGGDGWSYLRTLDLMVGGDLDARAVVPVEAFDNLRAQDSHWALGQRGEWFPLRTLLLPLLALPFYVVGGVYGLLAFNVLLCFLLVWLVYRWGMRGFSDEAALLGALVYLAAGPVTHYSYNFSSDVLGAVLVLAALVRWRTYHWWRLVESGALAGLACWVRPTYAVVIIALASWGWSLRWYCREYWDEAARFILGAVLALLPLALWNWWAFGAPWVSSYDRVVVITAGVLGTDSSAAHFTRPLLDSLWEVLVGHPTMSVLRCVPWLPVFLWWCVAGGVGWVQRGALAATVVAPILVLATYEWWDASSVWNRFWLMPGAVSSLALAWAVERIRR